VVRTLETGEVSRVALDTGELTPIARLPPTPPSPLSDDHLVILPGGDLIAIDRELGANVAKIRVERGETGSSAPGESTR
jgi:hypothetical protein